MIPRDALNYARHLKNDKEIHKNIGLPDIDFCAIYCFSMLVEQSQPKARTDATLIQDHFLKGTKTAVAQRTSQPAECTGQAEIFG